MTLQEAIDSALQTLGVIEAGESADATDSATALDKMNEMMFEWQVDEKDFNWFKQDTLGDTLPVPEWAETGIISNLAVKCAVPFRVSVTPELAFDASNSLNIITRTLINLNLENTDMSHLPQGTSKSRYNIETDT